MFRFDDRLLWKIALIISLLSPFIFFSSSLKPWKQGSGGPTIVQELLYPFESVWGSVVGFVSTGWNRYIGLTQAAEENHRLKSEMNQLSARLLDYEERLHEINRLRKLLGFAQSYENRHIVAEVIGGERREHFYTLRISKGEWDEVRVGMPVITGAGVVGRVIRTGAKFSDVHLIIDPNFSVDVLLQRTRVRGVLKGQFGMNCLLKLNRRAEIRIGDTIVTSGILGSFPKGLPVGRAVRISYESDDVSQVITVDPWVDYRTVEEVIVLKRDDQELQRIGESAGKAWLEESLQSMKGG